MNSLSRLAVSLYSLFLKLLYKPLGIKRIYIDLNRLNNGDAPGTKEDLIGFMSSAKKTLRISAGELNHHFYNDKQVIDALRNLSNDVQIEIVYDRQNLDKETKELFNLEKEGLLKTYQIPRDMSPHFWVIDGTKVLDELPHSNNQEVSTSQKRLVYIIPNAKFLGLTMERKFSKRKKISLETSNSK